MVKYHKIAAFQYSSSGQYEFAALQYERAIEQYIKAGNHVEAARCKQAAKQFYTTLED